jgi:hypothetical protein
MVVHKAPQTFRNANKAAHTFVLGDSDYPVGGFLHRQGRTHPGAIAALIANFNPVIGPILYYPYGAFFFVLFFEVSLGTDFFTGTAAGTFAGISNEFFQGIFLR